VLFTEKDVEVVKKLRSIFGKAKHRRVSSITIFEVYKLSLDQEGRDIAEIRTSSIKNEFNIIDVDSDIAEEGARIANKSKKPMADCLILGTAKRFNDVCVTDDPHFDEVKRVWL
jgi:predicted nucleic acid-binding protein